jgi:hypothetical protein
VFKNFATVFSIAGLLVGSYALSADCSAQAKSRHSTARGAYLVPPPPPYQPSILPEYGARYAESEAPKVAMAEVPKVERPYSKYIYTRNVLDASHVVQPNKYVTYWKPAKH